jgi:biotin carboxylase
MHHLAITGRGALAEPFLETGNFIPAFLPDGLDRDLMDIAGQAIAAMGARTGCFHTEIKLTPKGPYVIEVNGRVGGSIPELFELAGLPSFLDIVCRAALGEPLRLDGLRTPERVAYDLVLPPPVWATHLTRFEHVEIVGRIPGVDSIDVNRTPGSAVDWRQGYDGRIYSVFGSADDHDAMWAARQRILDTLIVEFT